MTWEELQACKQMYVDRDNASDLKDLFRNFTNPNYSNKRIALLEGEKNRQVHIVSEIPEELLKRILVCVDSYEMEIQMMLDDIQVQNIPKPYLED